MKEFVRTILDYPVKGIQFRDITTLLQDAGHFKQVVDEMTEPWRYTPIDAVLSIESRGFIMAGAIAYNIDAAFIPLRKPDKLPGETFKVSYTLECPQYRSCPSTAASGKLAIFAALKGSSSPAMSFGDVTGTTRS